MESPQVASLFYTGGLEAAPAQCCLRGLAASEHREGREKKWEGIVCSEMQSAGSCSQGSGLVQLSLSAILGTKLNLFWGTGRGGDSSAESLETTNSPMGSGELWEVWNRDFQEGKFEQRSVVPPPKSA